MVTTLSVMVTSPDTPYCLVLNSAEKVVGKAYMRGLWEQEEDAGKSLIDIRII